MGIKKGTKLTSNPKDILYQIRVDKETDGKVKAICEKEGISKSEVIRQGIKLKYKSLNLPERKSGPKCT
ncbi:MAG: ribbon-helix-helix domain-containing protein [Roseburia sp.]|nr:ribbon-helix-helix domain-containing protein [Roseburia sp.]